MNLCNTCSRWEPFKPDEWGVLRGAGVCHAARQMWDVTERVELEGGDEVLQLLSGHAGLLSVVEDGSGYRATLITMPDFGCVQHSAGTL